MMSIVSFREYQYIFGFSYNVSLMNNVGYQRLQCCQNVILVGEQLQILWINSKELEIWHKMNVLLVQQLHKTPYRLLRMPKPKPNYIYQKTEQEAWCCSYNCITIYKLKKRAYHIHFIFHLETEHLATI